MVAEVREEAGTATVGSHQQRNSISTNHSTPTSQSTAASVTSTPPLPQRVAPTSSANNSQLRRPNREVKCDRALNDRLRDDFSDRLRQLCYDKVHAPKLFFLHLLYAQPPRWSTLPEAARSTRTWTTSSPPPPPSPSSPSLAGAGMKQRCPLLRERREREKRKRRGRGSEEEFFFTNA
ncbi:hypothetical protein OsI_01424 [Oryza sativa Indica Group]|uniref:Uncharacterized protein n=1 Tax=Oryza sativa subsp. indica TaxID=39946 RepID=B8ACL3_ORYSI|nr:hypothetical protein OsI_01424 [Oryza sativa Indica Group]